MEHPSTNMHPPVVIISEKFLQMRIEARECSVAFIRMPTHLDECTAPLHCIALGVVIQTALSYTVSSKKEAPVQSNGPSSGQNASSEIP
jgi:hypothetical protein